MPFLELLKKMCASAGAPFILVAELWGYWLVDEGNYPGAVGEYPVLGLQ